MVLERRGDCSLILARVYGGEREKRRRKKEGRRKKRKRRNLGLEFMFGSLEFMFRTFLVSVEPMYGFVG